MQFSKILTILAFNVSVNALPAGGLPANSQNAVKKYHCPPRGFTTNHGDFAVRFNGFNYSNIKANFYCPNCKYTGYNCNDG
ncbi:hypothetical protein PgNI_10836 [Pyricularia grisea]|uniref:Uncharacterized protein n=1 Tax=Pyricularia grisea TaxID=148305 RepID=A0A6P8AYT5_PYRGI|nr:hypothetical protein PgNI_10836 [Pyricularia grisea]TLD07426.1 hypothetical protein PgNI_10836 [Pyricularia grisea]